MPEWEVFRRRSHGSGREPQVTIQRGGMFSYNQAAFEAMGSPEAVELLFSPRQKLVAFRGVEAGAVDGYQVRKGKGQTGYLVSGSAFLKYNGVRSEAAMRFQADVVDGLLVIRLADGVLVGAAANGGTRPMRRVEIGGGG